MPGPTATGATTRWRWRRSGPGASSSRPTARRSTARWSASTAPCSRSGPTATRSPPTSSAITCWRPGCTAITTIAPTPPSKAAHPSTVSTTCVGTTASGGGNRTIASAGGGGSQTIAPARRGERAVHLLESSPMEPANSGALEALLKRGELVESTSEMTPDYLRELKHTLLVSGDTELISAPAYYLAARKAPSVNAFMTGIAIIQDELAHAHIAYH